MNIGGLTISKKQIILTLLLLIGIIVGVILVQRQQLFKSKATQEFQNAFEVTSNGQPLNPDGNSYETDSLDVEIKVIDLEPLLPN